MKIPEALKRKRNCQAAAASVHLGSKTQGGLQWQNSAKILAVNVTVKRTLPKFLRSKLTWGMGGLGKGHGPHHAGRGVCAEFSLAGFLTFAGICCVSVTGIVSFLLTLVPVRAVV